MRVNLNSNMFLCGQEKFDQIATSYRSVKQTEMV